MTRVRERLADADLPELAEASGVPLAQIREAAELISQSERGIFMWSMGLTHHEHGTDNIRALGNVALARGFLGRPGAGLMPIRGHSNVQGVGSMGVSPTLKAAFAQEFAGSLRDQHPTVRSGHLRVDAGRPGW